MKINYINSSFLLYTLVISACSPASGSDAGLQTLIVKKSSGEEISYQIEVADSDVSRRRGLMYRKYMPEEEGMLLDFRRGARVGIWMKNTFIALDLLFINNAGEIIHIHEGAVPLSTRTITGGNNVRAVLEINAGQVEQKNIQVGDRVVFPSFVTGQ